MIRSEEVQGSTRNGSSQCASEQSMKVLQLLYEAVKQRDQRIKNHNHEMLQAVQSMERLRQNWQKAEEDCLTLREQISDMESDISERDKREKILNAELRDTRAQLKIVFTENQALKADMDEMDKRFKLVKELLHGELENLAPGDRRQLAFLNQPGLTRTHSNRVNKKYGNEEEEIEETDSLSYDEPTGDTLDFDDVTEVPPRGRKSSSAYGRGRRSASAQPGPSAKRSRSRFLPTSTMDDLTEDQPYRKRSKEAPAPLLGEITTTTTITMDTEGVRPATASVAIRRSMNRSMSESNLLAEKLIGKDVQTQEKIRQGRMLASSTPKTTSTLDLRTPKTPYQTSWLNGYPLEHRPHNFERLSSIYTPGGCAVCNGTISFAAKKASKCVDCQQSVHVACQHRLALPCVPRNTIRTPQKKTPTRAGQPRFVKFKLQEFCPSTVPRIPFPIIHLVTELEKRCIEHEGLYRVPGNKLMIGNLLYDMMYGRAIPSLKGCEAEVLTGAIKEFLSNLRDPLILKSSRLEFVQAAAKKHEIGLKQAVVDLPIPSQHTLAYLILHWKKVASMSAINKMPYENIARCVALSVLGRSINVSDTVQANREASESINVLIELLKLDSDFWLQFVQGPSPAGLRSGRSHVPVYGLPSAPTPCTVRYQLKEPSPSTSDRGDICERSILGPLRPSTDNPPLIRPVARRPQSRFFDNQ